jgi:hypothetical protein
MRMFEVTATKSIFLSTIKEHEQEYVFETSVLQTELTYTISLVSIQYSSLGHFGNDSLITEAADNFS